MSNKYFLPAFYLAGTCISIMLQFGSLSVIQSTIHIPQYSVRIFKPKIPRECKKKEKNEIFCLTSRIDSFIVHNNKVIIVYP